MQQVIAAQLTIQTYTLDTAAPSAPVIDPVNGTDPITGTAEPGSTVTVTYPNGDTATVVAGPDGTWTVPNPGLNDGDKVEAIAADPAGNPSLPGTATVDAVAPAVVITDLLTNDRYTCVNWYSERSDSNCSGDC